MQQNGHNTEKVKINVGKIITEMRKNAGYKSLNEFALSYGLDRGNLSKIERGLVGCSLITILKITEASGYKFTDFAQMLEKSLKNIKFFND